MLWDDLGGVGSCDRTRLPHHMRAVCLPPLGSYACAVLSGGFW